MNKKTLIIVIACFAGLLALGGILSLFKSNTPASNKIKVVAAENTWGSIAAQVGGDRVDVTSIISDPAADPHLYETGAHDASAITNADVVIVNGLGYDDFITKILDGSPRQGRTVINIATFLDAKEGENPHFWYDIGRVGIIASEFQKQFTAKDQAGADTYRANFQEFFDSLQPLFNKLDAIQGNYPAAPVAYTERVPGYLTTQSGLKVLTPATFASAIEDGTEPSIADQTTMQNLITGKKIRALLYNSQASSPVTAHLRDLAQQNNVPVVTLTETIPSGGTSYQTWMQSQLDAVISALIATK